MKVVWLAPFPIDILGNQIDLKNPDKFGRGNWLVNLSCELKHVPDFELHIISYSANINRQYNIFYNGIHFHLLKYVFPFTNRGFPKYFKLDALTLYSGISNRILQLIFNIKPDLVHAHGTEGAYALIAAKTTFPSIVSIQGIIHELYKIEPSFFYFIQKKIEKRAIQQNHYFGCRTLWDKEFTLSINPSAKVLYLPEAINSIFYNYHWLNPTEPSIVFIGSIVKRKGIEDLMTVVSLLKQDYSEIRLKVIGATNNNKYNAFLRNMVCELKIENNISWLGYLKSENIAEVLINSSLQVLPSYSDNSPNSICEAMAIGMPSVAYSTGGIPTLISNNQNGVIVNTGDIQALYENIRNLLSSSEKRAHIGKNARNTSLKRNYPPKVASITIEQYHKVLNE